MTDETNDARPQHVHLDDLPWSSEERRGREFIKRKAVSAATAGRALGCSVYELPAGGRGWPHHYHHGNEEALFVLEGQGQVRLGTGDAERTVELRPGTWVVLPVGPAGAHSLTAGDGAPLRYLCLSTMNAPDITAYPDSGKFGLFAGSAPGGAREQRSLTAFVADKPEDYWEREP